MKQWVQNNFWLFFCGIFAFIGTIMGGVFATLVHSQYQLRTLGERADAEVIEMTYSSKGTSSPTLSFTTRDGETVVHNPGMFTSPAEYQVGDRTTLWYDPADPHHLVVKGADSWLAPLITGVFFLIFGGIGYGGFWNIYRSNKRRAWLLDHGQAVDATFTQVRYNTSLKVNGASPYVIEAQWLDKSTNKVYQFKSENLWFDPTEFIGSKQIRVLIDPKDPGRHLMDLSFLPEAGN